MKKYNDNNDDFDFFIDDNDSQLSNGNSTINNIYSNNGNIFDDSDLRKPVKRKKGLPVVLKIMLSILAVLMLITCSLAAFVLKSMYTKPKIDDDGMLPSQKTTQSDNENEDKPTDSDDVYSRKDDFYNFLIIGRDSAGLNTDVIMVVSFDVKNSKISLMQIPRDTYVEIDGESHKMNSVLAKYYVAAKREGKDENYFDAGAKGLANVISANMNINLDYYMLVNLEGFRNIIDILGGVYMYVPRDMFYEDPEQDLYINLKEGWQTLNGKTAEMFVRFRKGYAMGDIGRVEAQKLFLSALFNSVKTNISIDKIPSIVEEAIENLTTNISLSDMIYFAKNALKVDLGGMNMVTLPGEGVYRYGDHGASYYVIHKAAAYELVKNNFFVFKEELAFEDFDVYNVFTNDNNEYINTAYNKEFDESETVMSGADELYKNN